MKNKKTIYHISMLLVGISQIFVPGRKNSFDLWSIKFLLTSIEMHELLSQET